VNRRSNLELCEEIENLELMVEGSNLCLHFSVLLLLALALLLLDREEVAFTILFVDYVFASFWLVDLYLLLSLRYHLWRFLLLLGNELLAVEYQVFTHSDFLLVWVLLSEKFLLLCLESFLLINLTLFLLFLQPAFDAHHLLNPDNLVLLFPVFVVLVIIGCVQILLALIKILDPLIELVFLGFDLRFFSIADFLPALINEKFCYKYLLAKIDILLILLDLDPENFDLLHQLVALFPVLLLLSKFLLKLILNLLKWFGMGETFLEFLDLLYGVLLICQRKLGVKELVL